MTDSSLRKLDEKKQTLTHMREILADKLENKHLKKRSKSRTRRGSNFSEDLSEAKDFPFPLGRSPWISLSLE